MAWTTKIDLDDKSTDVGLLQAKRDNARGGG